MLVDVIQRAELYKGVNFGFKPLAENMQDWLNRTNTNNGIKNK